MGLRQTFVNFALLGLFVFAMISFVVNIQQNNDVTDTLLTDSTFNKTYVNLQEDLDFQDAANNQSNNQDSDKKTADDGSLIFESIMETGRVTKGVVQGVYSTIIVIPSTILGVPEIAVIVLSGIISMILVLFAWRAYKAGE